MLQKNLRKAKYTAVAVAIFSSYLFLDYTLPRYDLVKINEISTRRFDEDGNYIRKATASTGPTRDVEMILTKAASITTDAEGKEKVVVDPDHDIVYINEDTGWDWPPYFKFETANIQSNAAYIKGLDGLAYIESYGWRIEFFSWFGNVLSITDYEPGIRIINFVRYAVLAIWVGLLVGIWCLIRWAKRRIAARVEAAAQAAKERADAFGNGIDAVGNRVDAFNNSEGMQSTRRRFWKIFGNWW
ncbi:DUF1523 family protein [Agrobacterium rubi]|nr:DUF1523 family protein [Agrobacterium rubi]NTF25091.1 DUF1523 family protein [Agrobacterium rubi]